MSKPRWQLDTHPWIQESNLDCNYKIRRCQHIGVVFRATRLSVITKKVRVESEEQIVTFELEEN